MSVDVYLEVGRSKVFACAADWPGWCRAAKDEERALEALAAYAERYRVVADEAGVKGPPQRLQLEVVERLQGSGTTDFGAPGAIPELDGRKTTPKEAERQTALVRASWRVLEQVAATAPPTLRKGPRGGGRDRDAVVAHVLEAEDGYSRKLGVKVKDPAERRAALLELFARPSDGTPHAPKGWPPRYGARRIAWHALDHAWEIEDKSEPATS